MARLRPIPSRRSCSVTVLIMWICIGMILIRLYPVSHLTKSSSDKDPNGDCPGIISDKNYTELDLFSTWCSQDALPRTVSQSNYSEMIQLVSDFLNICERANITPILGHGSLLGSYMFHDVIPWDDDIDLWIPYDDIPKVKRHFRHLNAWKTHSILSWRGHGYVYQQQNLALFPLNATDRELFKLHPNDSIHYGDNITHSFKFYRNDSPKSGEWGWNWPFIDVTLIYDNNTHVWPWMWTDAIRFPKDRFYPLVKRPFNNLWIYAPRDTNYILKTMFRNFRCESYIWNHRVEAQQPVKRTECSNLWGCYPQVWSEPARPGLERETLRLAGRIIQKITLSVPNGTESHSRRPNDIWYSSLPSSL